jgi:2-oxoisovalerate dehydrogenase E1 component beta subunit
VVAPSTAEDAKGLLIAAIRDPNPVVFCEHKHLYRRVRGEVPDGTYETPLRARVAREGDELCVIAYGAMVHTALEATEDLDGAAVEVLDLRSLVPLDEEAILASVRKTSKVLVLHEDTRSGGFGGEIAATIAEEAFEDLDAPLVRIAAPDSPVPFSPPLEKAFLPQVEDVVAAIRKLAAY